MKRILSLVLALVMVFGTIMPAFAESTDSQAGQDLESYGIIAGDGTGLNESGTLTRAEMTVILAKLNGKAVEASAYAFESSFTDDKNAWYTPWVAYAATQGWMSGYPDNTFKPSNVISVQEVNILMVQALGYDGVWGTANKDAADLGVAVTAKDASKVLRGEIFTTLRAALDVNAKGANETLGSSLTLKGYETPTPAIPTTLEIVDVMTDNLKTIIVEFNQEINKKTVNTTNFKVTGLTVSEVKLSEDKKTVTMIMSSPIAQSKEIEIEIKKVKNVDDSLTMADYKEKQVAIDVTIPVIESVTVIDAKHVKVQASEPMNWNAGTFTVLAGVKLDGKSFVGKVEADHQNFTYTIEFNSVKKEGAYTLNVEGVKDYASLSAVKKDFSFDVTKDDTAPVALSATSVNVNAIEVTFDEPLATIGTITINGKSTVETFKDNSNNKIVIATFTNAEDKLNLGATVEVVVKYKGQKDVVGNEVKTETQLTFKVEDDTALPTANIEVEKANKMIITFSKSMDTTLGKIIVMDAANKVKKTVIVNDLASSKWSETNTILTLVGSDLGLDNINPVDRIIQLKDMKDNTVRANLLATTDYSIAVLDTKTPVVTGSYTVSAGDKTSGTDYEKDDTITFYFSEAMDEETVKNLSNFKRNSEAGTFATVPGVAFKSIATDGKSAVFTYPSAVGFSDTFTVFALKDLAGNMVDTVTAIAKNSATLTAAPSVIAKKDTEIEVTYPVEIATADPSSIVLEDANGAYTAATSASIDGKVVTYTLSKALPTDPNGITVELNNTDLLISVFGDKYSVAWAENLVTIADVIAPTITAIDDGKWDGSEVIATENFAVLTFSETIAALPGTLANLQQDLVVKLNGKILENDEYTMTLVNGKYVNVEVYSNEKVTTDDKYELSIQVVRPSELADTPEGNTLEPVTKSITNFDYNYTAPSATAEYQDVGDTGRINRIVITATGGNITEAVEGDFILAGGDISIDSISVTTNVVTLTVTGAVDATSTNDTLAWAADAFKIDGVAVPVRVASVMTDKALPQVKDMTALSSNTTVTEAILNDIVTYTVNFTEPVTVSGVTATTFTNATGTITADLNASAATSDTISVTAASGDDGVIDIATIAFTITDANGNVQAYADKATVAGHATIPTPVTAKAIVPTLDSVTTADTDFDGKIEYTLTFSENIDDSTFTSTDFLVIDTVSDLTGSGGANDTTYVIEANAVDTDAMSITYTLGSLKDLDGNPVATTTVTDGSDAVAPVLVSVEVTTDGATPGFGNDAATDEVVTFTFSEPVKISDTDATAITILEKFTFAGGATDTDNLLAGVVSNNTSTPAVTITVTVNGTATNAFATDADDTIDGVSGDFGANEIEDVTGNDYLDTVTASPLTIGQ